MAELDVVIALVVVVAIEAGDKRNTRARDGRLETLGLGNDEIGGDAAVGPAANTKFVRIGNAFRNRVIHHRYVIVIILVAPVGVNRGAEFLAIARRTTRIGKQNGIAVGRIELGQMIERSRVLPDSSAMGI